MRARLALVLLAAALAGGCSQPSSDPLAERGRKVYLAQCTQGHNADPAQDGAVGPAVKGAPRELFEARILRGRYPPGYRPKRPTNVMPPQPAASPEIPGLAAYLKYPRGRAPGGRLGNGLASLRHLGGRGDDDLLRRPDDEPDVGPHEAAEHAADEDRPAVGHREKWLEAAEAVERDEQDVEPAGDEGEHRAPAEPPQRAPDQAPHDHAGANRGLGRREERRLYEVEVVEHPDPRDAGEEVKPPQQEQRPIPNAWHPPASCRSMELLVVLFFVVVFVEIVVV